MLSRLGHVSISVWISALLGACAVTDPVPVTEASSGAGGGGGSGVAGAVAAAGDEREPESNAGAAGASGADDGDGASGVDAGAGGSSGASGDAGSGDAGAGYASGSGAGAGGAGAGGSGAGGAGAGAGAGGAGVGGASVGGAGAGTAGAAGNPNDGLMIPCAVNAVYVVCHNCHSDPPSNGAPFPLVTLAQHQSNKQMEISDVSSGVMPAGIPISDAAKKTIVDWLLAGAQGVPQAECP